MNVKFKSLTFYSDWLIDWKSSALAEKKNISLLEKVFCFKFVLFQGREIFSAQLLKIYILTGKYVLTVSWKKGMIFIVLYTKLAASE